MVDMKIGEVATHLSVTEGIGPLSPAEVQKLVALVKEQLRAERDRAEQHERDTGIKHSAFRRGT